MILRIANILAGLRFSFKIMAVRDWLSSRDWRQRVRMSDVRWQRNNGTHIHHDYFWLWSLHGLMQLRHFDYITKPRTGLTPT